MTRKPATSPRLAYKGDRLKPLRAFCQTARLGSVSRAAEALFVSQPAVTQQLQSLERELGVPLLERSGRRMVPTREGEVLYELAVPLVEGLDALPDAFRQQVRGLDAGELHIAANSTTTLYQYDEALMDIVLEEAEAFFAGTRSAKDAAAILQNRAQTYISESR